MSGPMPRDVESNRVLFQCCVRHPLPGVLATDIQSLPQGQVGSANLVILSKRCHSTQCLFAGQTLHPPYIPPPWCRLVLTVREPVAWYRSVSTTLLPLAAQINR